MAKEIEHSGNKDSLPVPSVPTLRFPLTKETQMDRKAEIEKIAAETVTEIQDLFSLYEPSFHSAFENLYHSPSDVLFTNKRKNEIGFAIENPDENKTILVKMKGQILNSYGNLGCETALFSVGHTTEVNEKFLTKVDSIRKSPLKDNNLIFDIQGRNNISTTVVHFDKNGSIVNIAHGDMPYSTGFDSFTFKKGGISCEKGYTQERLILDMIPVRKYRKYSLPTSLNQNKQLVRKENSFGNPPLQTEIRKILEKLPFEPSK